MIFGFWNHFRKKRYLLGLSWGLGACLEPLGEVSGGDGLLVEPFGNFSGRSCGSLGHSRGLLGSLCGAIFLLIVGAGLDIDSEVHKALTRRPKPNPKL